MLTLMGFLGAVVFVVPSLVRTPVSPVSLVDVAVQVLFPAVPVAVPPSLHVVSSLATQVTFPVTPAHVAA